MGITIKDLSELSGYSTATISRVISNKGGVKKETREEIEKLLIEKHYRTNIMELRRAREKNTTVVMITGDLENHYYMEIATDVIKLLEDHDYHTYLAYSCNQKEREEQILRMAIEENCAGLIFMNVCGGDNIKAILSETGVPVVFLNRGVKTAYFNSVCNDNYTGAYQAVEFLIKAGHKKIGHLMGNSSSTTAQDRRRGFMDAMDDHGIAVTKNSIYQAVYSWEGGYEYGEQIIKRGLDFTAVFIGNYQMTEGFIDCMKDYGVSIPENMSIICFDETPEMRRYEISTVCAAPGKMASSAVELLLRQMSGEEMQARRIYEEPLLIQRRSVKEIKNV